MKMLEGKKKLFLRLKLKLLNGVEFSCVHVILIGDCDMRHTYQQ